MSENISYVPLIIIATVAIVVLIIVLGMTFFGGGYDNEFNDDKSNTSFEKFQSEDEYESYINQEINDNPLNNLYSNRARITPTVDMVDDTTREFASTSGGDESFDSFDTRQTNVQEYGVGEADIVKVLDNKTYYSQQSSNYFLPREPRVGQDARIIKNKNKIYGINNPNKQNFNISQKINLDGKMLRNDENLIVYNDNNITGFSVSKNDNLSQEWEKTLNDSNFVETTRRIGSKAYFVVKQSTDNKCVTYRPIESYRVKCTDIYMPGTKTQADSVFTVFSLDMNSGTVEDEISFVGSGVSTSVYMSSNSLYVSYKVNKFNDQDVINLILKRDDLNYSDDTKDRLEKLADYNISNSAKMVELRNIINKDENIYMTDVRESIQKYISSNKRDLFKTSIIKIEIDSGDIEKSATGIIPGTPLNQFSFDEHNGKLRVATTIKPNDQDISANDLYILDSELNIVGSEQGMAKGQRIYAVRFVGDKGYAITYRQIDPLHVIDLTDSSNPTEVGTLKLPGFSEYLHKLDDGMILGVGESQNQKGKLVLFNVTNPSKPKIADDLILKNTYSTSVSESHHAFMNDDEKSNVYIPAQNKVFVVDYSNNKLNLESKIDTGSSTKRTRLYEENIVVFSERDITNINRKTYDKIENINLDS